MQPWPSVTQTRRGEAAQKSPEKREDQTKRPAGARGLLSCLGVRNPAGKKRLRGGVGDAAVCLLGIFNPRRLADSPVESWHGFFYRCMCVARARGLE